MCPTCFQFLWICGSWAKQKLQYRASHKYFVIIAESDLMSPRFESWSWWIWFLFTTLSHKTCTHAFHNHTAADTCQKLSAYTNLLTVSKTADQEQPLWCSCFTLLNLSILVLVTLQLVSNQKILLTMLQFLVPLENLEAA